MTLPEKLKESEYSFQNVPLSERTAQLNRVIFIDGIKLNPIGFGTQMQMATLALVCLMVLST